MDRGAPGGERIFLGLGSNLGDPPAAIRRALDLLTRSGEVRLLRVSPLYRTSPVGPVPQGDFVNGVAEIATSLPPASLLARLKEVERALGRDPGAVRWGPRIVDLDILLWGDRLVAQRDLEIPHPEMHRRRFVLEPLARLAPEARHPAVGRTAAELLAACGGDEEVIPCGSLP
jgi:2-amino-4-hydroxy-6-hydroxymethyldihydropteridine diphosphokinase